MRLQGGSVCLAWVFGFGILQLLQCWLGGSTSGVPLFFEGYFVSCDGILLCEFS